MNNNGIKLYNKWLYDLYAVFIAKIWEGMIPCQQTVEILVKFISFKTLKISSLFKKKTKPMFILYSVNYYEMVLHGWFKKKRNLSTSIT